MMLRKGADDGVYQVATKVRRRIDWLHRAASD